MKKTFIALITIFSLTITSIVQAGMLIPNSEAARQHAQATAHSPVISETIDGQWDLERVDFVHYAKPANEAKPARPPKTDSCYKLLGVKWTNLPVNYVIYTANPDGLSENFITNTISSAAETWDNATSRELFNDFYTINYGSSTIQRDFKNALVFNDYPDPRVIAVTSIWYTRVGKQIVEFDILFNTYYEWGDATASTTQVVMDLQNIATHELGHGVGLNDVYQTTCGQVTMYGYSDYGEIIKRDLETADKQGLWKMYGI